MNEAVLGANCFVSSGATNHAVVPPVGLPSEPVQSKAAPPHAWTSMPRCCLYQACSAGAFFDLKKTPPMPVTRFMRTSGRSVGGVCDNAHALAIWRHPNG